MIQLPEKQVVTVSALTQSIKFLMEAHFPFVWVEGEISNFRTISSGTSYFTLKDEDAQIRTVLFKANRRYLRFQPEDGMHVLCQGRVSVYEARGEYQLVIDHMEPRGVGALQKAFLALRDKLQAEGIFAAEHKKALPLLPRRVGVISSTTGAALYDFLRIAQVRFPNLRILVYPTRVQGEGAAQEMCRALSGLNQVPDVDVIVLARGGGSFEDLWAFNEEVLARAIFASDAPIVSAVGHEVDFTIADFVADARAATPTAAAELVVPKKEDLLQQLSTLHQRLRNAAGREHALLRETVAHYVTRLARVRHRTQDGRLRLDALQLELRQGFRGVIGELRRSLHAYAARLREHDPRRRLAAAGFESRALGKELERAIERRLIERASRMAELRARLEAANPTAILARGYSITRLLPGESIVRTACGVDPGAQVKVRLYRGELLCRVEGAEE